MSVVTELRRRNVFRVGVAYAIVAWLLVEVASVVLPTFKAPEWVMQVFTFLLILGFPLALIFAWAFELTPDGIKRESAVEPAESIPHVTGRKLDFAIIGLLAVAVAYFAVDKFVLEAKLEQAEGAAEQIPAAGWTSPGIVDVQIYALQGEKQKALAALRQAIDEGWRTLWWYYLKRDPSLESLHDEPEYQAMVAEIEADVAVQLARVREMERNGELELNPEVSATTP